MDTSVNTALFDDRVSVSTYSKANGNSQAYRTAWLLFRTVTEESKAQNRCFSVSLQAIRSDCPITIPTHRHTLPVPGGGLGGGGGYQQRWGGGVSGPKDKPDTDGGKTYLSMSYASFHEL